MISTVLGFNTAIIKQNDNFLALALKIKRGDNTCQTYGNPPIFNRADK